MRLIDADYLKEYCKKHRGNANFPATLPKLSDIPTVDAAPVIHANWSHKAREGIHFIECSNCGTEQEYYEHDTPPYCAWCGAKMDLPEAEAKILSLDEFYEKVKEIDKNYCVTDYLVQLRIRYSENYEWDYLNELYLVSDASPFQHEWYNDWYEGQKFIEILGFIILNKVHVPNYTE